MVLDLRNRILDSAIRVVRTLATRFAYKANEDGEAWGRMMSEIGRRGSYSWPDLAKFANQSAWYAQSAPVYTAVSKIAQTAAIINILVSEMVEGKRTVQADHAINQLLRKPNAWQSQFELIEGTFGFQELNGNAFWYLNGGEGGGQPVEIMLLRPDRVRIVSGPDTTTYVRGYVYVIDGVEIPLQADEVIHFPRWNPLDDYYGLSAMEVASLSIFTDNAMGKYNRAFFGKDNGSPTGLVSVPPTLGNQEFERVEEDWNRKYGSGQRKVAFIRAGSIDYKMTGITQKDMDFILGRKFEKEQIWEIYGIPPGMMDKSSTEANAKVGEAVFLGQTMWPKMVAFTQKLTSRLAWRYDTDTLIESEDIRPRDKAAERADLIAVGPFMIINEVREQKLNLAPVDEEWAKIPASGAGAQLALAERGFGGGGMGGGFSFGGGSADDPNKKPQDEEAALKAAMQPYLTAPLIVPKVVRTRAVRDEIDQFVKFAVKRAGGDPDFYAAQIERFTFTSVPITLQIAVKAWADVCAESPESLAIMSSSKAASIAPASQRVDLSGRSDPLAKDKVKLAKQLQRGVQSYLERLRKRLATVVRGVNAASKDLPDVRLFLGRLDDDFWNEEFTELAREVYGILQDAVEMSGSQQARMLQFSTGISYDPALFNIDAAEWAQKHIDDVLRKFQTTTQNGTGAIIARWTATPGATIADLIGALEESYLFSGSRAAVVGETEITRAFAAGQYLGAEAIAESAGVDMAVDFDMAGELIPAHVDCFCWSTPQIVYDEDENIIGMDMLYHTNNADNVCQVCAPRNDRTFTEIMEMGL